MTLTDAIRPVILLAPLLTLLGAGIGWPAWAGADEETNPEEITISQAMEQLRGSTRQADSPGLITVASPEEPPEEPEPAGEEIIDLLYTHESLSESVQRPESQWNKEWWSRGKFGGEIGGRYTEVRDAAGATSTGYDFALEAFYEVQPRADWTMHLGLLSADRNRPLSNWVDADSLENGRWLKFNEYWSRHEIKLTRGSALVAQFGRFAFPFEQTQLVFDNDLQLTAAYLQYGLESGAADHDTRIRAAVYAGQLLKPDDSTLSPARVTSMRLDLRNDDGPDRRFEAAVAYHDFSNVDTLGQAVASGDWRVGGITGKGETTNLTAAGNPGELVSDFDLANVWVQGQWLRRSDWPLEVEVEFVRNLGARATGANLNDAWYAGVNAGRCEASGDWQFGYDHAQVETDAVLAAVNRGEYATNYRGDRLEARYCAAPGIEWRLSYTWSENLAAGEPGFSYEDEEVRLYMTIAW